MTCRKCGRGVERLAAGRRTARRVAAGRWSTSCGGCALEEVEEQLRWCRFGWGGRTDADAPKFDAERLRLEARLREVLDEEDVKA